MTRVSGFSLIEMVVVLAVAGILTTVAVPSLQGLVASNRMVSNINRYISSMHLARSESVKSGSRVVLCKSATGAECTTSGGWEQGWLVFHDTNNNALHDSGEVIVQVVESLEGTTTLRGNHWVRNYISYQSDGAIRLSSGGLQMGALVVCDERGFDSARAMILFYTGRTRVREAAASTITSCLTS